MSTSPAFPYRGRSVDLTWCAISARIAPRDLDVLDEQYAYDLFLAR